ncbi:DNA polymerase III subunit tau [Vibrio aerogenes CECT 7868]|uniref:DNA polymerase III subunit gamma/tau n=1 Tax=Vibrio aerogenes CECT 7868 TaxID=1216006 RepID=A0A1M5Z8T4_9VIBR|nr:DNA polymerase III subunit gamma/tau [Vibrio aerogenes]SHI20611.1 DNA polymerase III subunit tau [Vibrio aerogenes CECT 7868]
MSYLALARKWRPGQFSEVVGQSHVLTALENALSQNRLHHAYLFSGTRGVGKTTIGRLFAKGLNCETGITAQPCGQCAACQEIAQGRFVDLLEIDAASRTRVEDTRELLDNVQYKPARGRFKVYLIDEVHMLSRHSFNALLKTLEEPPEYVKFLLATTDPQKLPVTILSRCLQFHLKPISIEHIEQQLEHILQAEGIAHQQRALAQLAHAADGSMRDALSLTDQAIALGNGKVDPDIVAGMLGTIDTDQALHLIQALSHKDAGQMMACVSSLAANGVAWDVLLQSLSAQLHRIAMYQMLPASLDQTLPDAEKVHQLAQVLTPEDVQLFYQIALKGREDLPLSPTPRTGLEMILLRMIAFRPADVSPVHSISTEVRQPAVQTAHSPAVSAAHESPETRSVTRPEQPVTEDAVVTTSPDTLAGTDTISSSEPVSGPAEYAVTGMPEMSSDPVSEPPASEAMDTPVNWPESLESVPPSPDSAGGDEATTEANFRSEAMLSQDMLSQDIPQEMPPQDMPPPEQHAETASQPEEAPEPAAPKSPLLGLRHQLRSQRLSGKKAQDTPKKSEATSSAPGKKTAPESIIDRLNQKQAGYQPVMSPEAETATEPAPDEPYQWRPQNAPEPADEKHLTPAELKKSLAHEKTPEMAAKLVQEVIEQDEWAAMISQLSIPKMVEQLALNSSYQQQDQVVQLTLRANQAHLNTEKAQATLNEALNQLTGTSRKLVVTIGDEGITPLERREARYQEKLSKALESLNADPNIRWIEERFQAQLDKSSVRPL